MNIENLISTIKCSFSPQPDGYDKKRNYKFGPVLGSGSYGIVKLARNIQSNSNVAIKIINKQNLKEELNLIENELETVKKLDHINIVKLLDNFESNKKYYFVFELAEGGELLSKLYDLGKFTEADAVVYVKQLLNAVQYLHNNNVVHRDIKPENLLLQSKTNDASVLKLSDFG